MSEIQLKSKVKIVQVLDPDREVAGSLGVVEPPQVGDTGEVIYMYPAPDLRVSVEKKDLTGNTIWFADFNRAELEVVAE